MKAQRRRSFSLAHYPIPAFIFHISRYRMAKSVDEDRPPGRFLLTDSANLMALPAVADSVVGTMETLSLLPLSQSELHGSSGNWIDAAFAGELLNVTKPLLGEALDTAVLCGGYPEATSRSSARRRTVLQGFAGAAAVGARGYGRGAVPRLACDLPGPARPRRQRLVTRGSLFTRCPCL